MEVLEHAFLVGFILPNLIILIVFLPAAAYRNRKENSTTLKQSGVLALLCFKSPAFVFGGKQHPFLPTTCFELREREREGVREIESPLLLLKAVA